MNAFEDYLRKHSEPIGALKEGHLPDILRPHFDEADFKDVLVMSFQPKSIPYTVDVLTICNEIHCYPAQFVVQDIPISVCFRSYKRHRIATTQEATGYPVVIYKNNQYWFTKRLSTAESQ